MIYFCEKSQEQGFHSCRRNPPASSGAQCAGTGPVDIAATDSGYRRFPTALGDPEFLQSQKTTGLIVKPLLLFSRMDTFWCVSLQTFFWALIEMDIGINNPLSSSQSRPC
jgi:hypothetical protein